MTDDGVSVTENQAFQIFDWGNDAYSFRSLANNRWVKGNGNADPASAAINNTQSVGSDPDIYSYENHGDARHLRAGALAGQQL
ncbi:hypothetical protein [Paenibacillus foliorum]|uniref:hypothetical protein n=1 Tax=Paenibacillus foliorum TaxID=2654974 RepID=UPI00149117F2|nr:hypothetical protein [Paenibacillus foliorum]